MPASCPSCWCKSPPETKIEVVIGDGAYDTMAARVAIAACGALAIIPPVEGAVHWPASHPGALERNGAIERIARSGRQDWKEKKRISPPLPGGEPDVPIQDADG